MHKKHILSIAVSITVIAASLPVSVQAQPVSNSSLYYRLGGSSPASPALNRNMNTMRLGLDTKLKLNYSCGKFDVGLSWATLMNGVKNLGATITGAVQAGISALPLYVLQRAHPGLYQLFQNFSQKADLLVASSLKSCEEMEAMIKNGQNPYEDWAKMAKGEGWKVMADASGDVVQAKAELNGQAFAERRGITWVNGKLAGGDKGEPISPINDISIAGYNATLGVAIDSAPSTSHSGSRGGYGVPRLLKAFKNANALAKFTTDVLGDQAIRLTQDQPTSTNTALGLGPKLEDELKDVQPLLISAVARAGHVSADDLEQMSASGLAITQPLLMALAKLPQDTRSMAVGRLSEEIAIHRIVDKALIARNVLITGMSLPEVQAAGDALKEVQVKIDRLTQYINDLLFEFRIRKEMTSSTALAILEHQQGRESMSTAIPAMPYTEPNPISAGKVNP